MVGRIRGVYERVYAVLKLIAGGGVNRSRVYRRCGVNWLFFKDYILAQGFIVVPESRKNYDVRLCLSERGLLYIKRFEAVMELIE